MMAETLVVAARGSAKYDNELKATDSSIKRLAERVLPEMPHLLSVPTKTPYLTQFPYENHDTPFDPWEVTQLQYMTLLSDPHRGVAIPRGDWLEEINSQSPHSVGLRSGTTTPLPEKDPNKPRLKMSLADYKAGKRPTPVPKAPATSETLAVPEEKNRGTEKDKSTAHVGDSLVNGHDSRKSSSQSQSQLSAAPSPANDSQISKTKSPVPLRENGKPLESQTLSQKVVDTPEEKKSLKRQSDEEISPAEKRTKIANGNTSAPSKTNFITKQPLPNNLPAKPPAPQKSSNPSTPRETHKNTQNTTTTKATSKSADGSTAQVNGKSKPQDVMPPLLSPLPPGLSSPDGHSQSGFSQKPTPTKSEQSKLSKSPKPKEKPPTKPARPPTDEASPRQESPVPEMPPLLSPTLPPIVERALERMKAGVSTEPRREKVRPENGEAAKAVKPEKIVAKVKSESSTSVTPIKVESKVKEVTRKSDTGPVRRERFIVKLKYKKRRAKDIQRILQLKPAPVRQRLATKPDGSALSSASTPIRTEEKKRPRPDDESDEPSAKKAKAPPPNIEVTKPRTPLAPAFRSPALSGPSSAQKGQFGTPKRGDAMKSVAMRRVDSGESHVQTPQAASISTPASAEKEATTKTKTGSNDSRSAEIQTLKDIHAKYSTMGTKLKRQMDTIVKAKAHPRVEPSEEEKRLGAVVGMECIIAYMVGFNAYDMQRHIERKPNTGESWVTFFQLLPFVRSLVRHWPDLFVLFHLLSGLSADALDKIYLDRFAAETPSNTPEYLKFRDEMVKHARWRVQIWTQFREQARLFDRQFEELSTKECCAFLHAPGGVVTMPIPDVKSIVVGVLEEFVERIGVVGWEKKVDF